MIFVWYKNLDRSFFRFVTIHAFDRRSPFSSLDRAGILWLIDWARFNAPPNTLYVISGTSFYDSNDPTNNIKALKKDRVLRVRLQSHQVDPTVLTIIQQLCSMKQKKHTKYTQINTNRSTHMKWAQWQNPVQRIVRTAHLSVLMTVHSFSTQYNTEQFW